jgi:hypothetical protein
LPTTKPGDVARPTSLKFSIVLITKNTIHLESSVLADKFEFGFMESVET